MEFKLDEVTGKIIGFRIGSEREEQEVLDALELIRKWLLREIDDATAVARRAKLDRDAFIVATVTWQTWLGDDQMRWRADGNRLVATFVH